MKDKITTSLSNQQLETLIQFANSKRGAMTWILGRLQEHTGKQWRRENVQRWLHPDPERRTQPLFGVGLALVEIGQELEAENDLSATSPD